MFFAPILLSGPFWLVVCMYIPIVSKVRIEGTVPANMAVLVNDQGKIRLVPVQVVGDTD